MMALSMKDEDFKVQMFRFVDVLASLRNSERHRPAPRRIFRAACRTASRRCCRPAIRAGQDRARGSSSRFLRWNVSGMARQFISGRNPEDAMKTLRKARKTPHRLHRRLVRRSGRERTGSATNTATRCLELLEGLAAQTKGWTDPLGRNAELFPVVNLSVKISALYSQMNPADPEDAIEHLAPKLRPILRRAKELGAFVNFDMESYAHKNSTLELFKTLFTEPEFKDWPHAGIVIQAYLRDAERDLRDLIEWGRKRGTRFTVRLVKGAYWDYEKIKAAQNGWRVSGLAAEAGERREFRGLHARAARERRHRHLRLRFAQRPQHRARAGARGADGHRQEPLRISAALRHGGADQARARRDGLSRARILPGRRAAAGHGLSRQAPAREHVERRIPAREVFRQRLRPRSCCAIRRRWCRNAPAK